MVVLERGKLIKARLFDIRTNSYADLASSGGAGLWSYTYAEGGEKALRAVLELLTSIPFPAYVLGKAIKDLHVAGLDDIMLIVGEYLDKCPKDIKFCGTNGVFYTGSRCKDPEVVCWRCQPD